MEGPMLSWGVNSGKTIALQPTSLHLQEASTFPSAQTLIRSIYRSEPYYDVENEDNLETRRPFPWDADIKDWLEDTSWFLNSNCLW